ncbi:hypothetical protein [Actinacidiphila bryophytorum]|uniref:hypothetical protein n=1 Tax=Actinacidiphila bryophytorum TaxID=1436133 RepID=UPI002040CC0D|nr:hypothetical protein [Actinacidiphila bryophytorum]
MVLTIAAGSGWVTRPSTLMPAASGRPWPSASSHSTAAGRDGGQWLRRPQVVVYRHHAGA